MYGLEFVCLGTVLGVVIRTHRRHTHQNWIEARFLAERLRSGFFVAACGLDAAPVEVPPYFGVAHQPDDWMVRVFEEVWRRLPELQGCSAGQCASCLAFIREAWIQDQIKFHAQGAKRRHRISRWLEGIGYAVFGSALAAAAVHFAGGMTLQAEHHTTELALTFVAIAFPAVGAALAGIRAHREFARLVKRSEQMAAVLNDLDDRLAQATEPAELEALVRETEELMLRETQEWLMLMRFTKVEAGG
jgi:hypothetical protein